MSLAKEFEKRVCQQIRSLKDVYILRLYDFLGSRDYPSDFICYKKPYLYLLELKTTEAKSLSFRNIGENQWNGLLGAIKKAVGIKSLIICWFYSTDTTLAIDINTLAQMRKEGKKSIRYDTSGEGIYKIEGVKKNKYFIYNFDELFRRIT